jgi:formate hydrogenlyase subunit 3/multisubunit Na+/H+ antiporter MnhD subunit
MMTAIGLMILLPLVLALLLLCAPLRPWIVRALGLAPVPGLLLLPAAWEGSYSSMTLAGGWTYVLDQTGALMLAASTLLWIIGGFAASRWLAGRNGAARFALWWLLTLSGSLGVFVAGDMVSFYALYALASLPAYWLIAFSGSADDRAAGRLTLAAALIGEGLILAALMLLAVSAAGQGLAIAVVMNALPQSPHAAIIIALVVIGFGLKIGLVPLHGWMPLSYAAGPLAATAVLSGATSKAGIIGLIRFLPLDAAMPVAGGLILAAGLFSAFYGAALGLTQTNPRSVLAYSSISQLGQMAAVLGAGLAAGVSGAGVVVACYAVYHVLTKGGLFLMLGAQAEGRATPGWQLFLAGFMALGFAGLPLTGGALGKLAFKDVVGFGVTGLLFSLAAIGSTVLMLHFLVLVRRAAEPAAGDRLPALAWVAAGAVATILQWSLFAAVMGVSASYALKPGVLLELLWPVAAGALLFWMLAAAGTQLPRLPPGDISARGAGVIGSSLSRFAGLVTRFETRAHQWQVSSLVLAAALVIFVGLQVWAGR